MQSQQITRGKSDVVQDPAQDDHSQLRLAPMDALVRCRGSTNGRQHLTSRLDTGAMRQRQWTALSSGEGEHACTAEQRRGEHFKTIEAARQICTPLRQRGQCQVCRLLRDYAPYSATGGGNQERVQQLSSNVRKHKSLDGQLKFK